MTTSHWVQRGALAWLRLCARSLDAGQTIHAVLVWVAVVLVPALAVMGVHLLLLAWLDWVGAVLAFVWHVWVLYVTLGFRQFSHRFQAAREALEASELGKARELLAEWMRCPPDRIAETDLTRRLLEHSVVASHKHVFAVLGWYAALAAIGLGPAGAVLYRMAELASRVFHERSAHDSYLPRLDGDWATETPAKLSHSSLLEDQPGLRSESARVAQRAWWWIDWPSARLTCLGFAVVGSFEDVLDAWRSHVTAHHSSGSDHASKPNTHDGLIQATMLAALQIKSKVQHSHLAALVGLVWRSVVLWLLLIALLTLARLLG